KVLLNKYKADIEDPVLSNLPLVSGFIGSCSFDLVRHAFTKLREIEVKNTTDDMLFYMVESVYIFDHHKEKIHVITWNRFSRISTSELENRLAGIVEEIKTIRLYHLEIAFENIAREIETNISESDFTDTVAYFKSLIQKGDLFQAVPSRIYKYKHGFGENKNQITFQLYNKLKRKKPSHYMYINNHEEPIILSIYHV